MWKLKITPSMFLEIYGVEPNPIFSRSPLDMDDLWANFMPNKLWRLNYLYTITDKYGAECIFNMNWAQHVVYAATLVHPRIIVLKSRQQGISTMWLVSYFDDAIIEDNFEIGLMTQGQKESKVLFRRVKRLWERLPQFVKDYLAIKLSRDTKEELGFSNGAVMYLQTSFRSGTLQRLHISELGKISAKYPEKAIETKTGSLQAIKAGNTVVLESTAEGRKNMFYELWYAAVGYVGKRSGKDFYPVFLSWADDPDCAIAVAQAGNEESEAYFVRLESSLERELTPEQKWWWISQKRELGDKMGQEYPGTPEEAFEAVRDGAYYAVLFRKLLENRGRVVTANKEKADNSGGRMVYMEGGLYDPALKVEVAMDLGINDSMELVFFQRFGREKRIIDYYYNTGEGLSHYVNVMKDKQYSYGTIWTPHDVKVRELGTGVSRLHRLRELGVKARVLKRADVNTGIEQVRKMMDSLWIDADLCGRLIMMFFSYSKAWDDKLGVWRDAPLHDEWSNPADAVRYMAMSKGSGKYVDADEVVPSRFKGLRSNVVGGIAL